MRESVQLFEYETKDVKLTGEDFRILKKDFSNRISVVQTSSENYSVTAHQYVGNLSYPNMP